MQENKVVFPFGHACYKLIMYASGLDGNDRGRAGFTLVELLIVVAIIAIIAVIAIPKYADYRTKSYNSAAHSDVRNLKTGFEAYYADTNTFPPAINVR